MSEQKKKRSLRERLRNPSESTRYTLLFLFLAIYLIILILKTIY